MVKQDLVVKLLLDSGAFGNDLRQAERKAQDFKNNLQGAGKSAGEFSKAIGLSTGALGKLGGVLGGAGAVVAGVEAFKSVMESTHTTAQEFKGTIAGFEGVLSTLQTSFATFDFSNFTGGMEGVIELFTRAKEAKKASMDYTKGGVAYGILAKTYDTQLKELESALKKATTQEEGDEIKKQAKIVIDNWREKTEDYSEIIGDAFVKELIKGDNKINKNYATPENISKVILQWAERQNNPELRTADENEYKDIKKAYNKALRNYNSATNIYGADAFRTKELGKIVDDILAKNQDLFILNQLYTRTAEELQAIKEMVDFRNEIKGNLAEREKNVIEWNFSPKGSGSGSGSGSSKDIKFIEGSIGELREKLKNLINERDNFVDKDSERFKELSKEIDETTQKLEEYENLIKGISDEPVIIPYDYNMELLDEGNALLSKRYDENLLQDIENTINDITTELPQLHTYLDDLPLNTDEWRKTLGVLSEYYVMLEKLKEKYKEVKSEEKNQINFDNLNIALNSTNSLLNGVSGLLSSIDNESAKMASNMLGVFSSITDGIMNFIQVQQAAALASGVPSAAAMPFPYNLAAIASVMGTVLSVFANIKSMVSGKFAEGGIVGGTSYTGDKLFAMVNSGEMILNKRQQKNLSNMLGNGGQVEFVISGDSLVGVLNNKHNKRNLTR